MKYAIHVILTGIDEIIEADDPGNIYYAIERFQSLDCLYNMGMAMETTEKGKEGLKNLGEFLGRLRAYDFSVEDFRFLNMDLSCGVFLVPEIAEGEEAVETLKQSHPESKIISC